jgi:hypothetical protein
MMMMISKNIVKTDGDMYLNSPNTRIPPISPDRDYDAAEAHERLPCLSSFLYDMHDHIATCGSKAHACSSHRVMIQRMSGMAWFVDRGLLELDGCLYNVPADFISKKYLQPLLGR